MKENIDRSGLADRRNMTAHSGRLAGFDQSSGAEIDIGVDLRENADSRDNRGAKQPNHHNLQMRRTVGTIHRMVHYDLPFCLLVAAKG
jgi:hypothetical protein